MRVGDTERDACVELLQQHYSAGRLSLEELQERVGRALSARTEADLAALLADLPAADRSARRRRIVPAGSAVGPVRRGRRLAVAGVVVAGLSSAVVVLGVGAAPPQVSASAAAVDAGLCGSTGRALEEDSDCPAVATPALKDLRRAVRAAQNSAHLARRAADKSPRSSAAEAAANAAAAAAHSAMRAAAGVELASAVEPGAQKNRVQIEAAARTAERAAKTAAEAAADAQYEAAQARH